MAAAQQIVQPTVALHPPPETVSAPSAPEEGEVAIAATAPIETMPDAVESEAPHWPDEAAESAFLSDRRTNPDSILPAPRVSQVPETEAPEANLPLPPLNTLVDKIPPETREVLEDLFRVRFVLVKRVRPAALK